MISEHPRLGCSPSCHHLDPCQISRGRRTVIVQPPCTQRPLINTHDRASAQPAGHADGRAQITQICTPQSATSGGRDLRQNGGSVRGLARE